MIKIIVETLDSLYKDSEELQEILKTCKTKRVSNWWYLHGKLESDIGYDKGIMLDNDLLECLEFTDKDISKSYQMWYLKDGVYDVEIIQINKPCKGYFWTTFEKFSNIDGIVPHTHGLVCYSDDKEANKYAYKKYVEKSLIL